MTREEFEALLEEAFIEGYNDAIDEIFDEDIDSYNESKNVRNQMDKLKHVNNKTVGGTVLSKNYYPSNPKRDWTKFTNSGRGAYRVSNRGSAKKNSEPRGRIKSGFDWETDDPRSKTLKELVNANKERYMDRMKGRLRPFKNKGNNYDD